MEGGQQMLLLWGSCVYAYASLQRDRHPPLIKYITMKTNLACHMVQGHFQLTLFVHVSVYLCKDTENYPIWYDLATKKLPSLLNLLTRFRFYIHICFYIYNLYLIWI